MLGGAHLNLELCCLRMHGEGQTAVISAFACNPMLCPRPVHKFLQRINYTSSYTIKTWPLEGEDAGG